MELFFIDSNKKSSKREEELQDSYKRAHAARVGAARIKARRRIPSSDPSTQENTTISNDLLSITTPEIRNVFIRRTFLKTPVSPGFGSFRGEMLDMLPSDSHVEDFRALDFFTQITLPDIDVVNEMFSIGPLFGLLLPSLMTAVGYHAFLAMIHVTNAMQQSRPYSTVLALQHRGLAVQEVRKVVTTNEDLSDLLLTAVACLATLEAALGHRESYEHHIIAMQRLFIEKGHLKLVSGQRLKDMKGLYSDTTFALNTGRSVFDRRKYDPTPFAGFSTHISLPQGFIDLLAAIPLCQDTVDLLINAYKLGLHIPCVRLTPEQKFRMAQNRQKKRRYYTYLDAVPILLEPDRPEILFEKMLVLTLSVFAYCGFSNARYPQFSMYKTMMTQLVKRLGHYTEPETETSAERNCIAWMWLMAIDAFRTGDSRNGHVLPAGLDALKEFLRRFHYRTWTSIKPLTRLFFWNGNMEDFWTRNWDRLSIGVMQENTYGDTVSGYEWAWPPNERRTQVSLQPSQMYP